MKKMKVMLVGINSKFIHSNLAIRYLREYTKDLDYECILKEFSINDRIEKILEKIIIDKPNIVGFSCYIWNIEFVKALSKLIKLVDKNIEIFYGGPEVSFDCRNFLKNNEGEYIIEGEGEETFRQLLNYKLYNYSKDSLKEIKISDIKGLYYKVDNEIFYNGSRDKIDINFIPFPYKEDEDLRNKIVYYEGSRGCPFGCKYCLSSVDRKLRFRDIEKIKKELKFFIDKKVRLIKFVDRTFNCNEEFAIKIWKFLIEQDTKTKFHFEISANVLSEKQIEVLSKAPKGRIQFEVGVQTTNTEILRNINRYVTFQEISDNVKKIKNLKNIPQHLDLIAGLPGEDYVSFKKSFNDIYSIHPEEIQLGFLKILKGSPMEKEKEKWGIKHSPYPPYEVLRTNFIDYEELLKLKKVEAVVDKYYNSSKFNTILQYFNLKFDNPFEFFYSLGMFFEKKGYFSRNISFAEYYKVFLDFNSEKLKEDNKILKEIIKYDYLIFNKKKWIPEFLQGDMDKNWNKKAKDKVLNCDIPIEKNVLHIEKFNMDVVNFIKKGQISNKVIYLAFDQSKSNIFYDVTKILQ